MMFLNFYCQYVAQDSIGTCMYFHCVYRCYNSIVIYNALHYAIESGDSNEQQRDGERRAQTRIAVLGRRSEDGSIGD